VAEREKINHYHAKHSRNGSCSRDFNRCCGLSGVQWIGADVAASPKCMSYLASLGVITHIGVKKRIEGLQDTVRILANKAPAYKCAPG
jgi:hypothetical protein